MSKRITLIFVLLISLIFLSSCSKKNEQTQNDENKNVQLVNVDSKDLNESDKDLKGVNYKEIYDQLSSKGKWIQVSGKEIGLKMNSGTASGDNDFQKSIFSFITGVNDAYAEAFIDAGLFFEWQPDD